MMNIKIGNLKVNVKRNHTPGEMKLMRKLKTADSVFFARKPIKGAIRILSWEEGFLDIIRNGCLSKATVLPLIGTDIPPRFPVRYVPDDGPWFASCAETEYRMKTVHGEYSAYDRDLVIVPGYGVYHPNMFSKDGVNEKIALPDLQKKE